MSPRIRNIAMGFAFSVLASNPAAGGPPASREALKPRYDVEGGRLQPSPTHASSDGRYRLDARLQSADSAQTGSGIALKAKLVATATAACDASGLIFANGFE